MKGESTAHPVPAADALPAQLRASLFGSGSGRRLCTPSSSARRAPEAGMSSSAARGGGGGDSPAAIPAASSHDDSWEAERLDCPAKPTPGPAPSSGLFSGKLSWPHRPCYRTRYSFYFHICETPALGAGKTTGPSPGGEGRLHGSGGLWRGHGTVAIERTRLKIRASDLKKKQE